MRTLFWVLLAVNGLLIGYLIYHFATYEHTPTSPGPVIPAAIGDSIKLYRQRLAELERNAEATRERLDRVGKADWPGVHARYEALEQHIASLRATIERWETAPAVA